MIVLYDRKAIHDLLDKKSAIYSDRPPNYVADLVTNGDSIAFMNYDNPAWRAQRKISSHNLSVWSPEHLHIVHILTIHSPVPSTRKWLRSRRRKRPSSWTTCCATPRASTTT